MSKVKLTAEQKEVLTARMKEAENLVGIEKDAFIARTIGDVYDVELPIPKVIESISRVERADVGEHIFFNAPSTIDKVVRTINANCEIIQQKVTPKERTEVQWVDLVTEEVYVCLHEWLKADHSVLEFNADAMNEAMDRQEIFATLALVDAGATASGNVFGLESNKTTFTYPQLVAMARSVAKYGSEIVLITGGNVTTDVFLMNYDADKNQAVSIFDVVQKHIPIEDLEVEVNGSTETIIDPDVAYVVAVADSQKNRSLLTVRRKRDGLLDMIDTESANEDKERVVIVSGNGMNVGDKRKYARGFFMAQEYSATSINDLTYAKYDKNA